MPDEIILLAGTAATIGFVHTIFGPDHYLPFIVLSKAGQWSKLRTIIITFICGIGHILSSVVLGFIGIFLGIAAFKLEVIEAFRGDLAAWFLIAFGFTYFIWGIHRAFRSKPHKHFHLHKNGEVHTHHHKHFREHSHINSNRYSNNLTPWILFTIFVFGPCEPLIPLLMYPAANHNILYVGIIVSIFGLTTIATMLAIVMASLYGLTKITLTERYSHAVAGLVIFLCGSSIKFLGL